jgi:hypothetical protein
MKNGEKSSCSEVAQPIDNKVSVFAKRKIYLFLFLHSNLFIDHEISLMAVAKKYP